MKPFAIFSIVVLLAGCSSFSSGTRKDSTARSSAESLKTITAGVYGEVLRPQVYVLPEGSCVLEAVREKGGFTAWSFIRGVRIERSGGLSHGGTSYVVDLRQAAKDRKHDPLLKDGDNVFVPGGTWLYEGRPKELWACPEHTTVSGSNEVRSSM